MISKELLSEVLNTKVEAFRYVKDKDRKYRKEVCIICDYEGTYDLSPIEIANICKEWAFKKNYTIVDGIDGIGEDICYIIKISEYSLEKYYEQGKNYHNVFKACEWILKNKAND